MPDFSFARRGAPAFEPDHGDDYVGKPAGYGLQVRKDFFDKAYHKPTDTVKPDWDLSGGVEDLQLYWMVGYGVAQGPQPCAVRRLYTRTDGRRTDGASRP